jgi:hypothetical protein
VGSGTATFPNFPNPGESVTEQFIVSAHSGPLGEDPHGQITFHSPLLTSGHAKADVTCMTVTGNRARVGGVFSEPVVYMGLVFRWFELIVEDNGPPGHGTDRTTSFIFFDRPRPPDFSEEICVVQARVQLVVDLAVLGQPDGMRDPLRAEVDGFSEAFGERQAGIVDTDPHPAVRRRLGDREQTAAALELCVALAELDSDVVTERLDVGPQTEPQRQELLLLFEELVQGEVGIARHSDSLSDAPRG